MPREALIPANTMSTNTHIASLPLGQLPEPDLAVRGTEVVALGQDAMDPNRAGFYGGRRLATREELVRSFDGEGGLPTGCYIGDSSE